MERFGIAALYDLSHTVAADLLRQVTYPWEVLSLLSEGILRLGQTLPETEFDHPAPDVWIAKDATVAQTALIHGPCIIDRGAEVRHCAFIRGSVIVGKGCVVGNSTELKNAVLFDNVQVPHFNYVGDSVLGYRSHMGAGSVCSNVKSDKSLVCVVAGGEKFPTGRKKFGAMLGDSVEIACNSVLCPGTVVGKNSTVYPWSRVRGYIPANSIYKDAERIVLKQK